MKANTVCRVCWAVGKWGHNLCPTCRAPKEKARAANKSARYNASYRAVRAQWARVLADAPYPCGRCSKPIVPGSKWALDHLPTGELKPAHALCNHRGSYTDGNRK